MVATTSEAPGLSGLVAASFGRTSTAVPSSDVIMSRLAQPSQEVASGQFLAQPAPASGYVASDYTLWTPDDCTALVHALVASFSVILISELGDKTFIITAIMAMKNSRSLVFLASASALFLMTVLSVGMGVAVTVIPDVYTHYASVVLFLCFGFKMLKEAYDMDGEGDEFEEVERSLDKEKSGDEKDLKDVETLVAADVDTQQLTPTTKTQETATATGSGGKSSSIVAKIKKTIWVAPIVIEVFTMILVAEWGDRSQISTVILAAREDVVGVFVGSFLGHVLCTGLAVVGGRFVANMISVRTMTLLGGIVFLFFAAYEIISGPEDT